MITINIRDSLIHLSATIAHF